MNLIIEAGGTKSNLVFVDTGNIIALYPEPGLHLSRESIDGFEKRVQRWGEFQPEKIDTVFLFAAGKIDSKKENSFKEVFSKVMGVANIHIQSDLLAACYATAGNSTGLVGILGTGSNSCYYDGKSIIKNVSPGGFILGDEGSGSDIGKKLLIDYLRNNIPTEVKQALEDEYKLTEDLVIQNMYGGTIKEAVDFCSNMATFVISRLDNDYCHDICVSSIYTYLNLLKKNYPNMSNQLYLVGSVAFFLQDQLKTEAGKMNIDIIKIIQHPAKDLSIFLAGKYRL